MKYFFVYAFILIYNFSHSQQTYIPDDGFEQALIFEGLDTIMDDSISTSTIDTLQTLNLEPFGIIDLTGIADFVSLKHLICRNNSISSIDLSNNSQLTFLNCENNSIIALNVTNCPLLVELNADDNNLTTVDLTQNSLLEALNVTLNNIPAFDFTPNPLLVEFIAHNSGLNSVSFGSNTQVEIIDVSTNNLSSIDITALSNLTQLSIFSNDLTNIDLSMNVDLEFFFGHDNLFTELNFETNTSLTYIACNFSPVQIITLPDIDTTSHQIVNFVAHQNPNLTCIYTNYPNYIINTWNYSPENTPFFSNTCFLDIYSPELAFSIYPNPCLSETIHIESSEIFTYTLFSITGELIIDGPLSGKTTSISTSNLADGIYLVELKTDKETITKKIQIF